MHRRDFLKTAASGVALGLLTSCNDKISFKAPADALPKPSDSSKPATDNDSAASNPANNTNSNNTAKPQPVSLDPVEAQRLGAVTTSEPLSAKALSERGNWQLDNNPECAKLFNHGVASGDPMPNRVIIWTRLSIPAHARGNCSNEYDRSYHFGFGAGNKYRQHFSKIIGEAAHKELDANPDFAVEVIWEVARDAQMSDIVAHGYSKAKKSSDYTVKIDAPLPQADSTYFYRFRALGWSSPIGRTRSTPGYNDDCANVKMALFSCADLQSGYYNAYRNVAAMHDIALCVHVGDYIYETGYPFGPISRLHAHNLLSKPKKLAEFRGRFCQYRMDTDLQECHRQHPWAVIWDDHEFIDNYHSHKSEWQQIKANAPRAYEEWMPIRRIANPADSDEFLLYRQLCYGKLITLNLIDARRYRSANNGDKANDPQRTMLGATQKQWLLDSFATAQQRGCRWKVLANQIIFSTCKGGSKDDMHGYGEDLWNGFAYERDQIVKHLSSNKISDFVVLSGDWHTAMAFDIELNPFAKDFKLGKQAVGVELVGPAVTSDVYSDSGTNTSNNPHLRYHNGKDNGYVLLEFNQQYCQADFRLLKSLKQHDSDERSITLQTQSGANHLVPGNTSIETSKLGINEVTLEHGAHAVYA